MNVDDLLAPLRDVPAMPAAACAKRAPDWDANSADDPRIAQAVETCLYVCREFRRCAEWLGSLEPHERPVGVVAGRLIALAPPRKPPTPSPKPKPVRPPRARLDAEAWLADRLTAGPVSKSQLLADAVKAGLSQTTLERAARRLGVVSERLPGRRGPVLWSVPDAEGDPAA